jgi:putative transposase
MAQVARVVVPGLSYYVTHRGNRRADIFLCDEDRLLYLGLMRDYGAKAGLEFRAWCLMSNHVHFVLVAGREDSQRLSGWREWLAEPDDGEQLMRLRRFTQTGRPCGTPDFVAGLESALNRSLTPRKRGRKPRTQGKRLRGGRKRRQPMKPPHPNQQNKTGPHYSCVRFIPVWTSTPT